MKTEHVKITPSMAEKWLESVPNFQRKIDERQVKKLVMAIERNEWRENGATIVFNSAGQLIDGQHRLTAIAQSGKSVHALVVRNVSNGEATFHTIGDDKPRRVTDFLRCTNSNSVASVMRFIWVVTNGQWPKSHEAIPTADILKLAGEWTDYISNLIQPLSQAGRFTGQTSFIAFLVFYYTKLYPVGSNKSISEFFARVGDGLELKASDPAFRLRQRFLGVSNGKEISRTMAQALILKALNLHLTNQPCGQLRWESTEEFPKLIGYDVAGKSANLRSKGVGA